jgi:hypothetical protein
MINIHMKNFKEGNYVHFMCLRSEFYYVMIRKFPLTHIHNSIIILYFKWAKKGEVKFNREIVLDIDIENLNRDKIYISNKISLIQFRITK